MKRGSSAFKVLCLWPLAFLSLTVVVQAHPLDDWFARRTNAISITFRDVAYGNGTFVAVGSSGLVGTSPDGRNWVTNYPTSNTLNGVTFDAGQFLAVGQKGTVLSSTDGAIWTARYLDPNWALNSVRYGNSRFVATANNGTFPTPLWISFTSLDGITWSSNNFSKFAGSDAFSFGNGLFVQNFFDKTNYLSADGTNWWAQYAGTTQSLYTVGFAASRFVEIDIMNRVFSSPNATNWTLHGTNPTIRPTRVAFGNGFWILLGGGGTALAYSADLVNWKSIPPAVSGMGLTFGNGTFVVVGQKIFQSAPVIQLQSLAPGSLLISGPTNMTCELQAADDLGAAGAWQTVTNVVIDANPFLWSDPDTAGHEQRFYRVHLP